MLINGKQTTMHGAKHEAIQLTLVHEKYCSTRYLNFNRQIENEIELNSLNHTGTQRLQWTPCAMHHVKLSLSLQQEYEIFESTLPFHVIDANAN